MCSPIALMAVSTGVSAVGAYSQSQAQQDALSHQSQVAANNATIAEQQARLVLEQGATAEQNQRLKTAAIHGEQRAAMAANGIDLGEGTATELLTTTKYMGERDALTIRDNARRTAWGYQVGAQNYMDNSGALKASADSISPGMSAATSLLGSAASVAGSWYAMNKAGGGAVDPNNFQRGTKGWNGKYLEYDA